MNSSPRRSAILIAQAELALRPVYLDTETTGLDTTDQVVDICIVDDNGRVLVDSLVKPKGTIPPEVTCIHGITDEMVENAPTWPEIWPQVERAMAGRRVAIYNADFDVRMMQQSHHKYCLPWQLDGATFFCIMKLYAQFHGEWNYVYASYRWQKLKAAGQQCRIALPNAHRARADAFLARQVLHYMAEQNR